MKVGADANKLATIRNLRPFEMLDFVSAQNLDGIFYRTVLDLSPTLDEGELKEIKAHADELDLYLECGIGWVNPYNTPEVPHIRAFGKGDYRFALEQMIRAARTIDCTELWAVSAHSVHGPPSFIAFDRFRTDVTWEDQLEAIKKFLRLLAPLLRDLGCRVNLETHSDESSFELLSIIEDLGPDVVGVTLDTGNLPFCGDAPVAAAGRLAPHVHMTHAKDGVLVFSERGLLQQLRPLGEGIIDWNSLLATLAEYSPKLNLSIEDYRAELVIPIFDPAWHASLQPHLQTEEVVELMRLARVCEEKIRDGEYKRLEAFREMTYDEQARIESLQTSVRYLRKIIKNKSLG